ncbi:MAG: hypothetical protein WAL50_14795 [Kineosporiaceae bacterium]
MSALPSPSLDPDEAAAVAAVSRYLAMIDALAADPDARLEKLATVARGQTAAQWTQNLFTRRARGERLVGRTAIAEAKATFTGANAWGVVACLDVSNVDILDKNGRSVVPTDQGDRFESHYTVEKTESGWYVTTDAVTATC